MKIASSEFGSVAVDHRSDGLDATASLLRTGAPADGDDADELSGTGLGPAVAEEPPPHPANNPLMANTLTMTAVTASGPRPRCMHGTIKRTKALRKAAYG